MLIRTKDFLHALGQIKPAVSSKTSFPVLQHIKLEVRPGALRLLATDYEQWLETFAPARSEKDSWSLCVRFDRLERASKHWVAEDVSLKVEADRLLVTCGDYLLPLSFMDAKEMTEAPQVEAAPVLVPDFSHFLKRLAPFVHDSRTYMMCVHLASHFMEASDGRSLCRVATKFDGSGFLFPASAIGSVKAGECSLRIGESLIAVQNNETILTTKRIEGRFPGTEPVIPAREGRASVNCGRLELLSAVEYCEGQSKNGAWTNVWLDIGPKKLVVRLSAADGLPARKEMPCTSETELTVALSSLRLARLARAFEDEDITLTFNGNKEPAMIERSGTCCVVLLSRIDA